MNQIDVPVFKAKLLDELRSELQTPTETPAAVLELDQHRTPRHRSALLKVAAGVVVLAGVGAFAIGRSDNPPAYAMTESADGVITVTWQDGFKDGAALERSLRDAGVDATVNFLDASPSLVGTMSAFYPSDPDTLATGITYDDNAMIIDTSQVIGEYTVDIAIASNGPYKMTGSAFDHDEVLDGLSCAVGTPMQSTDIAPFIADQNLDVIWNVSRVVYDPAGAAPGPDQDEERLPFGLQSEVVDTAPAGLVLSARAWSPGTVTVDVLADGDSPHSARDFFESPTDSCTPERAARWNQ